MRKIRCGQRVSNGAEPRVSDTHGRMAMRGLASLLKTSIGSPAGVWMSLPPAPLHPKKAGPPVWGRSRVTLHFGRKRSVSLFSEPAYSTGSVENSCDSTLAAASCFFGWAIASTSSSADNPLLCPI